MIILWVDDLRIPPPSSDTVIWAKTSDEAIGVLERARNSNIKILYMSLDHDLGGDDTTRPIVLWCCENDYWPVDVGVHSANPVGREWLEGMIARYK